MIIDDVGGLIAQVELSKEVDRPVLSDIADAWAAAHADGDEHQSMILASLFYDLHMKRYDA